jgi:predicted membrane chloride channel (bestrophin family)
MHIVIIVIAAISHKNERSSCLLQFKWGISIANVADLQRPPEKVSYPQQLGALRISSQSVPLAYFVDIHSTEINIFCAAMPTITILCAIARCSL